jgi:hypothetical protein
VLRIGAADMEGRTPYHSRMPARPNLLTLLQIGMGVEAGFVIVLLAVILDRVMRIRRV